MVNVGHHLSCPSLVFVLLLRRAILDLELVLRAGPTLIDVFSKGVAAMDTLPPLCNIKIILNTNKFKSNKAHQIMAANVP